MDTKQQKIVVLIAIVCIVMVFLVEQTEGQDSMSTSEQKFRQQVEKLKDMGFKNGKRNKKLIDLVYALISTNGNVYKALERLHF